jgi:AraC-like DNA-binding protein
LNQQSGSKRRPNRKFERQGAIMMKLEQVNTRDVRPSRRADFWSDVASRYFTQLQMEPAYPDDFNAELRSAILGQKSIAQVISAPTSIGHSKFRAERLDQHVFLVHLQARGESVNRQNGREAVLKAGDFTLCDSARPYSLQFESLNDMIVLRIPATELRERLLQPELFTARRIAGNQGAGAVVSHALQHLWQQCVNGLEPQIAERLLTNCLDLLVTALSVGEHDVVSHGAMRNSTQLRVRYYVEDHLTEFDLSAARIGTAIGITPRYVHRLFEDAGETLGEFIQRRRLEGCALALRDPGQQSRSVTDIGFAFGFCDPSFFSRSFKKRFGMTPRDYRGLHLSTNQPRACSL